MSIWENIKLSLGGIRSNKMRSILTMLGIIIGIGAVIGIVTVGGALTQTITGSLQSFGVTSIYVTLSPKDTLGTPPTDNDVITDDMLEKLQNRYGDSIDSFGLSQGAGNGKIQEGRHYSNVMLSGISPGYFTAFSINMVKGRPLNEQDLQSEKMVAVISDKTADAIFGKNGNPLGQPVAVKSGDSLVNFTVVGVYKYESSSFMGIISDEDLPTSLYFPLSSSLAVSGKSVTGYSTIIVTGDKEANIELLTEKIQKFFDTQYEKNRNFSVQVFSLESRLNQLNLIMGTVSTAIAVIAGISLLVGGIGVMNIMLVSVTERTREIGTRKALGARDRDIRMQFITESMILCLIGGIIGILLGLLMGFAGSNLLGAVSRPSLPVIAFAVLFSMGIGVFFGYYPANKASKMDPIEALRYE